MCNLYSMTSARTAIVDAVGASVEQAGHVPPMPAIAPGDVAPIVRGGPGRRALALARWGMPAPAVVLRGGSSSPGAPCVRNVRSLHWSRWLAVENRCVVPFTSFAADERLEDGSSQPIWFAVEESRPLAWFAGIWTTWASPERLREHVANCDRFAIVTCAPNRDLEAIDLKAMPVILRGQAELDVWLSGPTSRALALQRPLTDGALTVVARGLHRDEAA